MDDAIDACVTSAVSMRATTASWPGSAASERRGRKGAQEYGVVVLCVCCGGRHADYDAYLVWLQGIYCVERRCA